MKCDRRDSLVTSSETLADALEHHRIEQLGPLATGTHRQGVGCLFVAPSSRPGKPPHPLKPLKPVPPKPTLVDFFKLRFTPGTVSHVLQSATRAMKQGHPRRRSWRVCRTISYDLIRVDHGWWGAQLVEPYVPEKVSWAIRYHQALRFYPDPAVGYEYPETYNRLFGKVYVPEPYIEEAYKYALNHKWYMEARLITLSPVPYVKRPC